MWGAIVDDRQGPLVQLQLGKDAHGRRKGTGLNGEKYVSQILRGPLKAFYDEVCMERGDSVLVVEDGHPAHRSMTTNQAREQLGICNLPHPPSSPDLNPIEPLWDVLKHHIGKIPGSYHSLDTLWEAAQKVWREFMEDDIHKHTSKMVDRVAAVWAAKSWHTKF